MVAAQKGSDMYACMWSFVSYMLNNYESMGDWAATAYGPIGRHVTLHYSMRYFFIKIIIQ